MDESPRKVLSAADAAVVLGVTRQHVHALFKRGTLTGFRKYKRLYVDEDSVRALGTRFAPAAERGRVTVHEVAVMLGVTDRTVRSYHARGLLRGGVREPGGKITFPPDVLDGFVKPAVGTRARMQSYNQAARRPKS